ncbi:MAG: hypothetical protein LBQ33_05505 [Oscillospiraceae bacterium]|nr:hypothetical protein [Oscillospiraceae bacterium]
MATYCPNPDCNRKLKLTDWRTNCPACGTNVLYYKMEERLSADADRVELEHAQFQKKVDRVRASLVGGKLAIARLVLLFLPIGTLFLPLVSISVHAPFFEKSGEAINVIALVNLLSAADFGGLSGMLGSPVLGGAFVWLIVALLAFVLILLAIFAGIATSFSASGRKGIFRNAGIALGGILAASLGMVAYRQFAAGLGAALPGAVQGAVSIGLPALSFAFLLIVIINVLILSKGGVPVVYKQCFVDGIPADEVLEAWQGSGEGSSLREIVTQKKAALAAGASPESAQTE